VEHIYRDTFLTPEEIARDAKIREAVRKEFPPAALNSRRDTSKLARMALENVIDSISEIDRECKTLLNGVEHGLVNVNYEFDKNSKHELLIAKLTSEKLRQKGWKVPRAETKSGYRYPTAAENHLGSTRKWCDLLVNLDDRDRLWIEIKLAWKAWFNCVGGPTYSNRNYLPYLQGDNHTHSFRGDLEKLSGPGWGPNDYRAVCLIGFDCIQQPMDNEVSHVVQPANQGVAKMSCIWNSMAERHWKDRRNPDFRINTWCWLLECSRQPA